MKIFISCRYIKYFMLFYVTFNILLFLLCRYMKSRRNIIQKLSIKNITMVPNGTNH